ncbi:hypothetical protein FRB99_007600 [Tulasnella sp. 403]|nr:hypothetical protein FRB99_007600 [Tulasnella sp. 403]
MEHYGDAMEVGEPEQYVFEVESCPVSWPANQPFSLNTTYPYAGIDPESQASSEYVTRRYLETLWLPDAIMSLENFVRDIQRLVALETQAADTGVTTSCTLLEPILLTRKDIKTKYSSLIPKLLEDAASAGNFERSMLVFAQSLEKESMSKLPEWLFRFQRREYQIQILLQLFLLTLPLPPEPPKKSRKKQKKRITAVSAEETLLNLLAGVGTLTEFAPQHEGSEDLDNGGWGGIFCERVIEPLFHQKLPEIYDMCLLSLYPSKYRSPVSSAASSPQQNATIPLPTPVDGDSQRRKSRSPSIFFEEQTREQSVVEIPQQRRSVSREFSRARSTSVFSLGASDAEGSISNSSVSRGGVATSKAIFARQVDMRKSTKDSKPKKKQRTLEFKTKDASIVPKKRVLVTSSQVIQILLLVLTRTTTIMALLPYTIVDAFTSAPFSGNPAAVIIIPPEGTLPDKTLQKVAAEFNLSETAFLVPVDSGSPNHRRYGLRWFTPAAEVPLCGHATLASARVLFSSAPEEVDSLEFDTLSGTLSARKLPGGKIELEFPAAKLKAVESSEVVPISEVIREAFEEEAIVESAQDAGFFLLVHVNAAFDLERATVKGNIFLQLPYKAVIVTSDRPSDVSPSARFVSRVFCPAVGISEDPVTGSAHCALAPYWASRLGLPSGTVMPARQASPRGGDLDVVWDQERGVVRLRGDAVVVARGEMYL